MGLILRTKSHEMKKIAIFDDHPERRQALQLLISFEDGLECIGNYANCVDIIKVLSFNIPDVVLMDIGMPDCDGISGVKLLQKHYPQILILMQTVFEDDGKIFQSICAGAHGYILKKMPPGDLIKAIYEVLDGGAPMSAGIARRVLQLFKSQSRTSDMQYFDLSNRETEILACLIKGLSQKMIADQLYISSFTVNNHMKKIYQKLHVHNASEAVAKAINNKIV